MTEAAAMAAGRWVGRGDKIAADQAAVDGMRTMLDIVSMQGTVVIGEGEKDEAPMLYNGEAIGNGEGPEVDVAVDPLEGTRLTANGAPNAIAVIAALRQGNDVLSGRGRLHGQDRRRPGRCGRDRHRRSADRERAAHGRGQGHATGGRDGRRARPRPACRPDRRAPQCRREGAADHGRRRGAVDRRGETGQRASIC